MSTPETSSSSSSSSSHDVTEQDRDCAAFARQALFPQQMHRDWKSTGQFPALAVLDRLRRSLMVQQLSGYREHPSALFPRGVLLVRDLHDEGRLSWNGAPDVDLRTASFPVIPQKLTVRCTSDCARLTRAREQTALLVQQQPANSNNSENSSDPAGEGGGETTLILCTDRLLQSDYCEPLEAAGVARELPPKSYKAIEEAVAHQIAKVAIAMQVNNKDPKEDSNSNNSHALAAAAEAEVEAAQAAECYYSRHATHADARNTAATRQVQIRRGSGLPRGYSKLPTALQSHLARQCVLRTAVRHLQFQHRNNSNNSTGGGDDEQLLDGKEARAAVEEALRNRNN